MFRPIRMDHTNCLQVAIKSIQFRINFVFTVETSLSTFFVHPQLYMRFTLINIYNLNRLVTLCGQMHMHTRTGIPRAF
jgi:hypothetical protein